MWDWLKDLFKNRPITQSVIGSAIVQIVWTGVSAVIGYISGQLAGHTLPGWLAILIGAVVFFLLSCALYLLSWAWSRQKSALVPAVLESDAPQKLTFEINEHDSQVHLTSGSQIRQIEAKIVLMCKRHIEEAVSVRAIHASLHRLDVRGGQTVVIAQERVLKVSEWPSMQEVNFHNGWMITNPNSNYRLFHFLLSIEPKDQGTLSNSHFLRVSMDAIGQGLFSEDIRVNSWEDAKADNSQVMLRRNYQGNEEIEALHSEIETLRTKVSEAEAATHALDKGLAGKKQEMKEVQRERDRYKQELDRQISLKEDLSQSYDEERQAALRLKTLNDQYELQIGKLNSDAEEARREKLAAASNLQGVESDRNNFRAWYNELSWIKPALEPQQHDISNHVTVIAARPCLLNLKERVVVVDLVIRNDSFFTISIKPDAVGGRFATKKGLLHDPAKALIDLIHPVVENLKPTKEATVAVIQPLLRSEAEDIEDAISEGSDGRFWLGNLNIPISVQNAEPLQVDAKPLRINPNVQHVYFREFGGLTFEGEVITPQELVRDIEALPFPERLRIYQEISKAYGESLWRLNEAKQREDPEEIANEAIKRNTNNA